MKSILLALSCILFTGAAFSQNGFTHFVVKGGAVYRNAWVVSAGLDFASTHHSSYELAFTYYRNALEYQNYFLGVHYKPVLLRDKNTTVKFRLGAFAGTDTDRFIAAPNLGIEWLRSISGKVDFILSGGNGYYFFADTQTKWRITAEAGFRLSF